MEDWGQKNINGFGLPHVSVPSLEVNGQLYAGTSNPDGQGAQVWRSSDGGTWSAASQMGFGIADPSNTSTITDLQVFAGKLDASTSWGSAGGQMWRSSTGTAWEQVADNGFGNSASSLWTMTVFGGSISGRWER